MKEEEFLPPKGDCATFIVSVQFRQNASWQGTIRWVDQDKTQHFRSALEMIKLIDSTLETDNDVDFQ